MAGFDGLDDRFRPFAEQLYDTLHQFDARFVVTSGFRTRQEQEQLFARMERARANGAPFLTTLPPGRSQHERGLAVDIARIGVDAVDDPLLIEAGLEWRRLGGTWGGTADPVHFGAPKNW
jgi:D-alanyl-D-alanine dipeptidase